MREPPHGGTTNGGCSPKEDARSFVDEALEPLGRRLAEPCALLLIEQRLHSGTETQNVPFLRFGGVAPSSDAQASLEGATHGQGQKKSSGLQSIAEKALAFTKLSRLQIFSELYPFFP